jgi:hypothetical protein
MFQPIYQHFLKNKPAPHKTGPSGQGGEIKASFSRLDGISMSLNYTIPRQLSNTFLVKISWLKDFN